MSDVLSREAIVLGGQATDRDAAITEAGRLLVASGAVDAATTSQSEADRNRGREIRKREERYGQLDREYGRQLARCQDGDRRACDRAREAYAEMQVLRQGIPVDPQAN